MPTGNMRLAEMTDDMVNGTFYFASHFVVY